MKMIDGKVSAALALKVALDDEDAAKVQALVEECGRLRMALDRLAAEYEQMGERTRGERVLSPWDDVATALRDVLADKVRRNEP